MRLFRIVGLVHLIGYLALCAIAGVFLTEATLHPARNPHSSRAEVAAAEMARAHDSQLSDVAIVARDGATLRAWNIRQSHGNGNAVLLLHGLANDRAGMRGYAELLLSRGFSVLVPDARAHGLSGGELATFGLLESDDIHRWLDWLEKNDHPDCIFGLGESMGAAQLLQSVRSETRFCAVAAESSFASFREIGYDRIGQFFGTGPWLGRTLLRPIIEFAFVYSRLKYKLNFGQVSPENVVAATKVPIFLIHGQIDGNIPVRHSRLIASRNPSVALWEVPNADHCGAIGEDPKLFDEKLLGWFNGYSRTPNHLALQSAQ
jgi:pimeloyl-ACP methyl ester carboxylesterase